MLLRILLFFGFLVIQIACVPAHAVQATTPLLKAAEQQLSIEQARNALLTTQLQSLRKQKQPSSEEIPATTLQRATLAVSLAQADLNGIALTLAAAQQALTLTENTIRSLEVAWQNAIPVTTESDRQAQLQATLKEQRTLLSVQQARVKVLQQTQQLAQQILIATQDWQAQIQTNYQLQQQRYRQQALEQLATSLQQEQQEWLARLAKLEHQLHAQPLDSRANNAEYKHLSMSVFEAEERSNLSQIELDLAKFHNALDDLAFAPGQILSLSALNTLRYQVNTLHQQLKSTRGLLQNKIVLLQQRIQVTKQAIQNGSIAQTEGQAALAVLKGLLVSYRDQYITADDLIHTAHDYRDAIAQQLKQQLSSRQALPDFNIQAWLLLSKKFLDVPVLTWQAMDALGKPLTLASVSASAWTWIGLMLAVAIWLFVWKKIRSYVNHVIPRFERRSQDFWTAKTILITLKLLQRYLTGFMLLAGLIGLLFLLGIPVKVFSLAISLALVILSFSVGIGLARLLLLEGTQDDSGNDVRLYYRLKWALLAGGFVTALTFLVHQLPVSYEVQDLFGRLFMLFLLMVALVLFKGWQIVPQLLEPYFVEGKRSYVRKIVRWLSLLVPLSLLFNALLGLIGYVELAWIIAVYQGLFLMVLTGYLLVRGLLDEFFRFAAEQLVRYVRNGWLWREALLKPLHQLLKIGLFLAAWVVLFVLYGWDKHSVVVIKLGDILSYPLFRLANTQITLIVLVEIVVIAAVLIWAARWTREFSYRWLFARTKDLGLRNSLAIFTQYTLVVIGIITGLNILGLNLTALTFVASAFAVGVGFGLRDLANNFACGVLLLIERPVKVGDWITVGNYEGQVLHIGARSVTVLTNDHQELLVPNADIFSKLFINWTRRDSIVRSLVMLKISRDDDPYRVREIILEVIKSIPNIVVNPPCEVYFKELDSMLLEFKLEYYVDIHAGDIRSTVRSKFLFALWDRFKAEGIRPPDYPHEVIINQERQNH